MPAESSRPIHGCSPCWPPRARPTGSCHVHPPLCFVVMPYGKQLPSVSSSRVDFEVVYGDLIKPAIEDAGLKPIRADQELRGGIFHKRMFERLSLCEYAVADLSLFNPNVFYELGIRHARRPWSTVLLYQRDVPLPLDVALAGAMPYSLDDVSDPIALERLRFGLTERLRSAHSREVDSPVFQLVAGLPQLDVEHTRLDAFARGLIAEDADTLAIARACVRGTEALVTLRHEFGELEERAPDVVVALVKAFRDQGAWREMVSTIEAADESVARSWVVQELLALALGRLDRYAESVTILNGLLERRENSETYGLLGGTYKRQWRAALAAGQPAAVCASYRRRAADAYRSGFESDWRDPYPGVNAVMLRVADDVDTDDPLVPVVTYAVDRRLARRHPEYWDFMCALELALLRGDQSRADEYLGEVLVHPDQPFDLMSTVLDLQMVLPSAEAKGDGPWVSEIIDHLTEHS